MKLITTLKILNGELSIKYVIEIDRSNCIACANCYIMDENHFEGDDEGYSMVVGGETDSSFSEGPFDGDQYDCDW